jgi:hypothetical protein
MPSQNDQKMLCFLEYMDFLDHIRVFLCKKKPVSPSGVYSSVEMVEDVFIHIIFQCSFRPPATK